MHKKDMNTDEARITLAFSLGVVAAFIGFLIIVLILASISVAG